MYVCMYLCICKVLILHFVCFAVLYRGCLDGWIGGSIDYRYDGCREQTYTERGVTTNGIWCFCAADHCNGGPPILHDVTKHAHSAFRSHVANIPEQASSIGSVMADYTRATTNTAGQDDLTATLCE